MRKRGKHLLKKENWNIWRLLVLLLALFCAYVGIGRRRDFYGPQKETAIGWDMEVGPSVIEGLGADTVLRQNFYPRDTVLDYIYVALSGHGQTGSMIVTVCDGEGTVQAVRELPCAQMIESGAQGIGFFIRVKPGKKYYYTITFAGITDTYPEIQTAYHISGREIGSLFVNEEMQEQALYGLYVYQSHCTQSIPWWIWMITAGVLLLYGIVYPHLPVWKTKLLPLFLLLHAALGVFLLELAAGTDMTQFASGKDVTAGYWQVVFCNFLLCCCLLIVLSLFLWNGKVLLTVGMLLCLILGIAEYYVLEFRGTPLTPSDLRSIGTAGDVSGGYQFDVTQEIIAAILLFVAVFLLEQKIHFQKYSMRQRLAVSAGLLVFGCGSFFYVGSQELIESKNNGRFFWNMNKSYKRYGFLASTYLYERYQSVKKPEGYSEEQARELMVYWESEAAKKTENAEAKQTENAGDTLSDQEAHKSGKTGYPNIIAIMNESFTTFDSVGGIETSGPMTPFLDSLSENTVKGNLYISMFGGGTANSEFEFLTGSSMRFLPVGSTPYQAYIKEELPSLASYLKAYDYTTMACHFADKRNWNRDEIYPLLGFDEFLSDEDAEGLESIHRYTADRAGYQEIERRYEDWKESGTSDHFFCFHITMQNHGGYLRGYRSEGAPTYAGGDADVDEFLSLIWESDKAFEELIHYFESEEEPTIILMFGDHWPKLNEEFLDSILEQPENIGALERNQNRYVTPFVIWANYDIEETQNEKLSANYLSVLLLKTAGIPLNGYQTFLDELSKRVPVINSLGYVDDSGAYFESGEETDAETADWILDAERLQYAHLFGNGESASFFSGAN